MAIETSRIAVVVFSKNYATLHWCLDELVKIMECKRLLNQSVLPIFYDVSQSTVLEQKEIFAEALLNGPIDKVNNWRTALKEIANLAGLHLEPHRIAVVVFSKNYATLHWCLDELVKIMECKRLLNQSVLPIFYDVSQSTVLEQKEIFAESLLNGPRDKVNNWRTALKEAANFAGLHLEPHRLGVGGTKPWASVEPTFLLGGWDMFLFVWYSMEENAMSDNLSVGEITGAK
ncbi:hypothetical protein RGQ29_002512 [Quercus rubra]|uniref:ADP-ribosyl cyclase/cyclic ADP-ribose hydrolase n=1 Tax=Quercus rubra TaxID=3512 RepID=A0AAN7E9I1_QUERU|nr:hypothetical protein RGQ29_002512 [Quercus rubra]